MNGNTHMLIGAATGLAIARYTQQPHDTALLMVGAASLAALLPDIDVLAKRVHLGWLVRRVFAHRGVTHSLWAVAVVTQFALLTHQPAALAAALGYVSHLVADAVTIRGIPFFYPNDIRLWLLPGFLRIRTGGLIESVLFVVLIVTLPVAVIGLDNVLLLVAYVM